MEVTPLSRYPKTGYPLAKDLDQRWLMAVPDRWQANGAVLRALSRAGVLVPLVAACSCMVTQGEASVFSVLSESDVSTIVHQEARRMNVNLTTYGKIDLKVKSKLKGANREAPYLIDWVDPDTNVAIDFVSENDIADVFHKDQEKFAKLMRPAILDSVKGTKYVNRTLVLASSDTEAATQEAAENNVRNQVRDFLTWLKQQGII